MSESIFQRKALVERERTATLHRRFEGGTLFLDFGKAAFGTLCFTFPETFKSPSVVVHLGEKLDGDGRVDREPPGSIRYQCIRQDVKPGSGSTMRLVIPPDQRNTGTNAIKMPANIGEVYPFRYVEIEDADALSPEAVRQIVVHYPFNEDASDFNCSDTLLNEIWELCKYSIKATTFCGVYVDGDRERIPYEGDAYINQLGHYCVDQEYAMARFSHEYCLYHPTIPTEWNLHSVLMAWMDYLYTGDTSSIEKHYDIVMKKTMIDLATDNGLISTRPDYCSLEFEKSLNMHAEGCIFKGLRLRDLVDWPPATFFDKEFACRVSGQSLGEQDSHEMMPFNTVVNAFHYRALILFSRLAGAVGHTKDQARFQAQAETVKASFNECFFDAAHGRYLDGIGSKHASLHSNMFALSFGLVPDKRVASVVKYIKSRGMACSVYGAQHLLDALFKYGQSHYAIELMTAKHDRSWWNMLQAGSTITWEAWDWKYKNNLDWNHAWGAAPANLLPRHVLGVRPLSPGGRHLAIQPQMGNLEYVRGRVPTLQGPVNLSAERSLKESRPITCLTLEVPEGTTVSVGLPDIEGRPTRVNLDGQDRTSQCQYGLLQVELPGGQHEITFA